MMRSHFGVARALIGVRRCGLRRRADVRSRSRWSRRRSGSASPRVERFLAAFFDSLAAARTPRQRAGRSRASRPCIECCRADSLEPVAWLDIFRDSTLVRARRRRAAAEPRSAARRSRGSASSAPTSASRARPLAAVSVTLNGVESTNQVALGAFPPTSYRATRFTGDLAWELDFWGRIRRGIQAASADLGAQEAAERAVGAVARERRRDGLPPAARARPGARHRRADAELAPGDARARARSVHAGAHVGARRAAVRGAGRGAGGDARADRTRARADGARPQRAARRGAVADPARRLARRRP